MKLIFLIITRVIGITLIALGIYMYLEDKEYTSSFQRYNGYGAMQSTDLVFDYLKSIIIGLILFFYNEIMKYINWVKYS